MEDYLLASCLIEHDHAAGIFAQQSAGKAEELPLSMRKVQVLDFDIEWMRVLALVALTHDNVPKLNILESLHNGFVFALLQRIGIKTD